MRREQQNDLVRYIALVSRGTRCICARNKGKREVHKFVCLQLACEKQLRIVHAYFPDHVTCQSSCDTKAGKFSLSQMVVRMERHEPLRAALIGNLRDRHAAVHDKPHSASLRGAARCRPTVWYGYTPPRQTATCRGYWMPVPRWYASNGSVP